MDVGRKAKLYNSHVPVFLFLALIFRIYSSIFNMEYIIANI